MMSIFRQYLFLIPVVVMLLSELTKAFIEYTRTGVWHAGFFKPGGLPSTHSAFVTSLLMVVERKMGVESVEFAIALTFAGVVWYDAMSVRRAVGEQAQLLNRLQHWKHLTERLGHSAKEVLAGITFGAIITQLCIYLFN